MLMYLIDDSSKIRIIRESNKTNDGDDDDDYCISICIFFFEVDPLCSKT